MSRGPTTFRQRDVTAAVKAVTAAGYEVVRGEVDKDGKIAIVTTKGAIDPAPGNEWDTVLETHEKDG